MNLFAIIVIKTVQTV